MIGRMVLEDVSRELFNEMADKCSKGGELYEKVCVNYDGSAEGGVMTLTIAETDSHDHYTIMRSITDTLIRD